MGRINKKQHPFNTIFRETFPAKASLQAGDVLFWSGHMAIYAPFPEGHPKRNTGVMHKGKAVPNDFYTAFNEKSGRLCALQHQDFQGRRLSRLPIFHPARRRKMQRMIAQASLLCALLAPLASHAWDVEPGITGAAITGYLPKGVTLQRVDVKLTGKSATLTYHGSSKAPESRPVVLTAYIHAFSWQGIGADYPNQHMPELKLQVNGSFIKDQPHAKALFNGTDVTRDLRRAKLDPLLVAKGEDALVDSPGHLAKPFLSSGEAPFFPLWQLSYQHTWTIPGIAAGDLSMEVAYRLRPAKTEIATASKQFEGAVLSHCGDIQAIKHILESRQGSMPDSVVIETFTIPIQFANTTSIDTYLTVHDVTSSTGLPVAAILACGPEDKSLLGTPSIESARTADETSLSILQILIQS